MTTTNVKKTVIVDYGRGERGKSTAIKAMHKAIKERYSTRYEEEDVTTEHNEVRALFTVDENIFVGIESQGDPNSRLPESIAYFKKADCDIIILACRSRGDTKEEVLNELAEDYRIIWTQNFYSEEVKGKEEMLNACYVKGMLQLFDDILTGKL